MRVKHLDHVNLSVHSLRESIEWYGRIFGFEVMESGLSKGIPFAIVRSGEAMLCLYEDAQRTWLNRFELRDKKLHGVNHFALRIEDRERWREVVAREQLKIEYEGEISWPHSTSWYILDPTGYEIEVVSWDDDQVRFTPQEAAAVGAAS